MKFKVIKTVTRHIDVAGQLKKYRLTQTAVAQEVGISRSYLTDIVNDVVITSEATAKKILKAINTLK